ncbi:MAG: hypothetical protein IPP74_15790 [Alphaproteobacteria bacterium]|nr:hypothetical protein [Alphaproteobacteria bacterium]
MRIDGLVCYGLTRQGFRGVEIFRISLIPLSRMVSACSRREVGSLANSTIEQITKAVFAFNALGAKAVEDAAAELKKRTF